MSLKKTSLPSITDTKNVSGKNIFSAMLIHRDLYEIVSAAAFSGIFDLLAVPRNPNVPPLTSKYDERTLGLLLKVLKNAGFIDVKRINNTELTNLFLVKSSFRNLLHELKSPEENTLCLQIINSLEKNERSDAGQEPVWSEEKLRRIGAFALNGPIEHLAAVCDLSGRKRLLDLGGGHGFYSIALAEKYPDLQITLFDLPQITELSEKFIRKFKLQSRINTVSGNFLTEKTGENYDAVLCANILHAEKRDIVLPKVRESLNENGLLIIKNRVSDTEDNLKNSISKLIWHVRGGKLMYTTEQWKSFIANHGFSNIILRGTYDISAVITAEK